MLLSVVVRTLCEWSVAYIESRRSDQNGDHDTGRQSGICDGWKSLSKITFRIECAHRVVELGEPRGVSKRTSVRVAVRDRRGAGPTSRSPIWWALATVAIVFSVNQLRLLLLSERFGRLSRLRAHHRRAEYRGQPGTGGVRKGQLACRLIAGAQNGLFSKHCGPTR